MLFGSLEEELDFWQYDLNDMMVLHIPHSSVCIPDFGAYTSNSYIDDVAALTDISSDKIFDVDGVTKVVFPFSRVWCDVERFHDDNEPMHSNGHGILYTRTAEGGVVYREPNEDIVSKVMEHYNTHHNWMEMVVESKLQKYGHAVIIDCHTFPDIPLPIDLDQSTPRPDVCIGRNNHTSDFLVNTIKEGFEREGLSVMVDVPYSGTYVPSKFFEKDGRVQSIMIEINRKKYMIGREVDWESVERLNTIVSNILKMDIVNV